MADFKRYQLYELVYDRFYFVDHFDSPKLAIEYVNYHRHVGTLKNYMVLMCVRSVRVVKRWDPIVQVVQ